MAAEPGWPCISPGCPYRVAHRLDVCRECRQAGAETLDEREGEPDDDEKNWLLAEHGYGEAADG